MIEILTSCGSQINIGDFLIGTDKTINVYSITTKGVIVKVVKFHVAGHPNEDIWVRQVDENLKEIGTGRSSCYAVKANYFDAYRAHLVASFKVIVKDKPSKNQ